MKVQQPDPRGQGISRRQLGAWLGSATALALTACGGGGSGASSASSSGSGSSSGGSSAGTGGNSGSGEQAATAAPVITQFPSSAVGVVGTSLTLSAQATGGQLSYQWVRNGLDIGSATSAQYSFTPSLADDGATYAIRVWNSAGTAFSNDAELTVRSDRSSTLLGLAGGLGGPGGLVGQGADSRVAGAIYPMPDSSLYIGRATSSTPIWSQLLSDGQRRRIGVQDLTSFSGRPHLPVAMIGKEEGSLGFYRWNNNAPGEFLIRNNHGAFYIHQLRDGDRDTQADVAIVRSPVLMDDGTLYFVDAINAAVRLLTPSLQVKTLARLPAEMAQGYDYRLIVLADGRMMMLVSNVLWRLDRATQGTEQWTWTRLSTPGLHTILQTNNDGTKIYSAQGNALVQLTPEGGVTVLAGSVDASASTRDGDARTARFSLMKNSSDVANIMLGADSTFWIGEGNQCLRQFSLTTGQVRTVQGRSEHKGTTDGQGSEASFNQDEIASWAADGNGNLYLTETSRTVLRRVTPEGRVSTLLDNFPSDSALAVGPDGTFYGTQGHAVIKISATGQKSVLAGRIEQSGYAHGAGADALFFEPRHLAWDSQGQLLVAENSQWTVIDRELTYLRGGSVRRVTPDGVVSSFIDRPSSGPVMNSEDQWLQIMAPRAMARNLLGQIAIADFWGTRRQFRLYENNGRLLRILTVPPFPSDESGYEASSLASQKIAYLAWDGDEALLWAEGNLIRRIDMREQTRIVAGTPGQWGVRRGALPGCLNKVAGLLGNPAKPKSYFVLSENSVLQMTL